MKWLYVACGAAGAIVAVGIITYQLYAYLHRISVATDRYDVQLNVLLVLGAQVGILLVPLGIGLGLLVAAVIGHFASLHWRKRPGGASTAVDIDAVEPGSQGASWVTLVRDRSTAP